MKDLQPNSDSYTVRYLLGEEEIPVPEHRRPWNNYIERTGARENNLKRGKRALSSECNDCSDRRQRIGKE